MSANTIQSFHLPPYHEIPDVGLYLDQVTRYINDSLQPLGQPPVTASMLSNYVKKGYVARPVRKQYFRDQIGYFFFMSLTKQVLPLEHYPRDADFGQHMLESAVISAAHRIYLNYCLDNYPVPTENPAGSPGQS